jgi:uncharacterized protein YigE (DUF2233 family)
MKGILGIVTIILAVLAVFFLFGEGLKIQQDQSENKIFQIVRVSPKTHEVLIVKDDNSGERHASIGSVLDVLQNKKMALITNGGIFKPDFQPEGLYVHNSVEEVGINTKKGEGNFYMRPGGVFSVRDGRFFVETLAQFQGKEIKPEEATQSGPMLILGGEINPRFNPDSNSKRLRSGVGVSSSGSAIFVISKREVTFFEFAAFLKENGAIDALYLDGVISKMYIPGIRPFDLGGDFSTMIVVAEK